MKDITFKITYISETNCIIDSVITIDQIYELLKDKFIDEGYVEAKPKRWVRPSIEDVFIHFTDKLGKEKGSVEANGFWTYWDSLDWYSGKTRIKSWKGRANTWIKNNEKYKRNDSQRFNGESAADKIAASIANRN